VCFAALALPLVFSCNTNDSSVINTAIKEKEKKKGNQLITIIDKDEISIPNNGTVSHYNAKCIKAGQDSSKVFSVSDSVVIFKTGDGIYITNQ
jgi:hypothetical protein